MIAAVIFGAAVNAMVQIFTCRTFPEQGWVRSFVNGFVAGLAAMGLAGAALYSLCAFQGRDFLFLFLGNLIMYGSFSFFYFSVVNGGKSALRVKLLEELAGHRHGITLEEMFRRYRAEDLFRARVERLEGYGQIVHRGGRYHVGKPVMLLMSKAVFFVKMVVTGKKSEFNHQDRRSAHNGRQ